LCSRWRLYVIVDRDVLGGRDPSAVAAAAARGGADVIQLRAKGARPEEIAALGRGVLAATRAAGIPLLINDYPEVAGALGAEGVHLGQDDAPLAEARARLGPSGILGKSTHSLEQAAAAAAEGATYIGVGPVYATPTKPGASAVGTALVEAVAGSLDLPFVCIGGLDAATIPAVVRAGARCVAVVRAVCAADDPEAAARALKRALTQAIP
jgi:thiamine-phosphate pyrophosphorylase